MPASSISHPVRPPGAASLLLDARLAPSWQTLTQRLRAMRQHGKA